MIATLADEAQHHTNTLPSAYAIQQQAAAAADQLPNTERRAKNIVFFVGDGMGMTTITAGRILDGQQQGGFGEENQFFFESFPYTALSKTYAVNMQTPDSASTMTAMMTGHKTKGYVVGYDDQVVVGDHTSIEEFGGPSRRIESLLERFEQSGRSTGVVTTTRVTDATPSACYAHSPNRLWESGNYKRLQKSMGDDRLEAAIRAGFNDIATQLVEFPYGDGLDVVLGGGWQSFLPKPLTTKNEEGSEPPTANLFQDLAGGLRLDGRNLIRQWIDQSSNRTFVRNRQELLALDMTGPGQLLGLFDASSLPFELTSQPQGEARLAPSLDEMALAALSIVRRNEQGFFLMIEGARIDHGHHIGSAKLALTEMIEFDNAIEAVVSDLTRQEREETLIVVTADHSHVFTMGGYPVRGNPILGKVVQNDLEGKRQAESKKDAIGLPFTTTGYANGPGFAGMMVETNTFDHVHGPRLVTESKGWKFINAPRSARPDLTHVDTHDPLYRSEAAVPLSAETHGGEDVPIYAMGPGSHLFRGTREQNYIYHAMVQATGLNRFSSKEGRKIGQAD